MHKIPCIIQPQTLLHLSACMAINCPCFPGKLPPQMSLQRTNGSKRVSKCGRAHTSSWKKWLSKPCILQIITEGRPHSTKLRNRVWISTKDVQNTQGCKKHWTFQDPEKNKGITYTAFSIFSYISSHVWNLSFLAHYLLMFLPPPLWTELLEIDEQTAYIVRSILTSRRTAGTLE